MRVPPGVKKVDDLPKEYEHVLGSLAEVREIVSQTFPSIDFTDPSWGMLEGDDYSMEFNVGQDDPCESIMLHVRGGDGALPVIKALCDRTGCAALDTTEGDFIDFDADPYRGFHAWQAFRDRVLPGAPQKGVLIRSNPNSRGTSPKTTKK